MIVGGMPQAVQEYVDTKDFNRVDQIKRNIINYSWLKFMVKNKILQ